MKQTKKTTSKQEQNTNPYQILEREVAKVCPWEKVQYSVCWQLSAWQIKCTSFGMQDVLRVHIFQDFRVLVVLNPTLKCCVPPCIADITL